MKLPRGFGKNYFSLNAITATVNHATMHRVSTCIEKFHTLGSAYTKEDETSQELEEIETTSQEILTPKGCHCSYYFLNKTIKTLKLFSYQKKFKEFYISLNNSISPPIFNMFIR